MTTKSTPHGLEGKSHWTSLIKSYNEMPGLVDRVKEQGILCTQASVRPLTLSPVRSSETNCLCLGCGLDNHKMK